MAPLNITAELNNVGASLLEAGRDHDAILMFRYALDAKMREVRNAGIPRDIELEESDAHRVVCAYEQLNRTQQRQNPEEPEWVLSPHASFYIYTHPMMIAPPLDFDELPLNERNGLSCLTFECAIVMFNIALVHHKNSMEQQWSRSCMEKAVKLYCMSHKFLQELISRNSMTTVRDGHIMFLPLVVLINNLGVIYYELGEYEKSRKCVAHLNQMMGGSRRLPFATSNLLVSDGDWEGMLFNAMMLTEPRLAAAA